MRRLSALLLPLVLLTAATAPPAVACIIGAPAIGGHHSCCDGQAILAAPAETCCVLSAPISDRALVESRVAIGKNYTTHTCITPGSIVFQAPVGRVAKAGGHLSSLHVRTTPLYLQQLSLLI